MIAAAKTRIIEAANVIPSNWKGNSGTGEGETVGVCVAVGLGVGVGVGLGVCVVVEVCVDVEVEVEVCVGAGVEAGLTVIETVLDAGDVTGVEALSVTVQVTECEVPAAV